MDALQQARDRLDALVKRYNVPAFVENDPIQVPLSFLSLQDREIAAFFTATMAWGLRKTIIAKARELMARMDNAPYDFVMNHSEDDLKVLLTFKHRTFQPTDVFCFVDFLRRHYSQYSSLEDAFLMTKEGGPYHLKDALMAFHDYFFDREDALPQRTRKHVATPARKSACKRLNMMLRWLVRSDDAGVDMGLWRRISMQHLHIPLDVHVDRIARRWGILTRKQTDWKAVEEVTAYCRIMDPLDPGKYDYALFGLGLEEKQGFF